MLELAILVTSIIGNSLLGVIAYKADKNSQTNKLFTGLVGVTIVWLITTYVALKVPPHIGLTLVRITMVLAAFQILFLYLFVHTFPKSHTTLKPEVVRWSILVACLVSAIAMSPYMFVAIEQNTTTPGPGIVAFLLYAVVFVGNSLWTLIQKLRHSKGILRQQLKFLTSGIVISFTLIGLMNLGVVVLSRRAELVNLTPLYTLFLIGFVAYAILTQHLFDIRVIISRAIIYSLLVGFTLAVYGLAVSTMTNIIGTSHRGALLASVLTAAALAYSFEPLRQFIAERTDSWLFKKEYEQQEVTKELSKRLANAIALDEGLDTVMQTLTNALHLDHAVTYVFQTGDLGRQVVKRSRQIGYRTTHNLELSDRDFIVDYFTHHTDTIFLEELCAKLEEEDRIIEGADRSSAVYLSASDLREHARRQVIVKKLEELGAAVAIPLHLQTGSTTEEP